MWKNCLNKKKKELSIELCSPKNSDKLFNNMNNSSFIKKH